LAAFALGLAFALCPRAYAATYTYEMANVYVDHFRKPVNLRYRYFGDNAPDYSALTPIGKGPAYIDYAVDGATDVTVYFYSRFGTRVTYEKGNEKGTGRYRFGVYARGTGLTEGQAPLPQAMLCEGSGEVYMQENGLVKWLVCDEPYGQYYFDENTQHAPPQGTLGYGVNIYHSEDGVKYTRAQAANTYLWFDSYLSLFYEAYSAKVPQQAKHIRVTLDEMANLQHKGETKPRGYDPNTTLGETGLALAAVSVYGDSLVVGVPDPIVLPEFPWEDYVRPPEVPERTIVYEYAERPGDESSSGERDPPKEETEEKLEEAPPILDEAQETEPRGASSKFTGTISENPERSSRQEAENGAESGWEPGGEYLAAEWPLERLPSEEAPAAIEIAAAPKEDTGFTKGVTAYIVLASGGLAALVLFKPKN
jgi:hypothetical protein